MHIMMDNLHGDSLLSGVMKSQNCKTEEETTEGESLPAPFYLKLFLSSLHAHGPAAHPITLLLSQTSHILPLDFLTPLCHPLLLLSLSL